MTVTVLTMSLTLQFVDGVDSGALGNTRGLLCRGKMLLVPTNFKNGAYQNGGAY